jgi:hypothetical protein
MEYRCPSCNAPVYSRKQKVCGVCEKPLPSELLFTDKQIAFLRKQDEEAERRAKEFRLPDPERGSDMGGMSF